MVLGVVSRIAGPFVRQQFRNLYQALRAQDRLIDYTYRKTGLYNRGVVRGIKHGLGGGAIVGGIAQLGLNAPDTPGNDVVQTPSRKRYPTSKPYKTRYRSTRRSGYRNTNYCKPRYRNRQSYTR